LNVFQGHCKEMDTLRQHWR